MTFACAVSVSYACPLLDGAGPHSQWGLAKIKEVPTLKFYNNSTRPFMKEEFRSAVQRRPKLGVLLNDLEALAPHGEEYSNKWKPLFRRSNQDLMGQDQTSHNQIEIEQAKKQYSEIYTQLLAMEDGIRNLIQASVGIHPDLNLNLSRFVRTRFDPKIQEHPIFPELRSYHDGKTSAASLEVRLHFFAGVLGELRALLHIDHVEHFSIQLDHLPLFKRKISMAFDRFRMTASVNPARLSVIQQDYSFLFDTELFIDQIPNKIARTFDAVVGADRLKKIVNDQDLIRMFIDYAERRAIYTEVDLIISNGDHYSWVEIKNHAHIIDMHTYNKEKRHRSIAKQIGTHKDLVKLFNLNGLKVHARILAFAGFAPDVVLEMQQGGYLLLY